MAWSGALRKWFYVRKNGFMGNLQFYKSGKGKFYDGIEITTAYQNFEESGMHRSFQDAIST